MATKTTTLGRGRDIAFTPAETTSPSLVASWLTGLMLIIVIALVASLLNSAAMSSRTIDGVNSPVVVPEGSTMPGGVLLRDGDHEALDNIASVPAGSNASTSGTIDSRISVPLTDRLRR